MLIAPLGLLGRVSAGWDVGWFFSITDPDPGAPVLSHNASGGWPFWPEVQPLPGQIGGGVRSLGWAATGSAPGRLAIRGSGQQLPVQLDGEVPPGAGGWQLVFELATTASSGEFAGHEWTVLELHGASGQRAVVTSAMVTTRAHDSVQHQRTVCLDVLDSPEGCALGEEACAAAAPRQHQVCVEDRQGLSIGPRWSQYFTFTAYFESGELGIRRVRHNESPDVSLAPPLRAVLGVLARLSSPSLTQHAAGTGAGGNLQHCDACSAVPRVRE